ncbi:MAG: right-handed parallel beta-helix repeat-containing protein [Candidatus Omnitrophica bacterium]|nr:right-handed parallel beta-helix repeat-containing protein [Candidatus Omnitrophota bacterium]
MSSKFFHHVLIFCMIVIASQGNAEEVQKAGSWRVWTPLDFGAKGDGISLDTGAIQAAIDACAAAGGGRVVLPKGIYLSGSLHLRSGVVFHLDPGSILRGSPDNSDYDPYEQLGFENDSDRETSFFHFALIWGEDLENIGIEGTGIIDGNRSKRGGPKPIALKRCSQVRITGITIENAPNYCISLLGVDYALIEGVTIRKAHCDGIDPDCCRHVRISNCQIESWDDAIVPKTSFSLGEHRPTEFLTITNCQLATASNCFKLGTESGGDFRNITVSNCVMYPLGHRHPTSGISLESVDGSKLRGVAIANISMRDVEVPIFIRLGNRGRDMEIPTPGVIEDVLISNVVAEGATRACSITGIPGHKVKGVTLSDIRLRYQGGGSSEDLGVEVPELIDRYPDADMFKKLPAFGLYCRHGEDFVFRNVQLHVEKEDGRHALYAEDVSDLSIVGLRSENKSQTPLMHLKEVQQASIRIDRLAEGSPLMAVSGKTTMGIAVERYLLELPGMIQLQEEVQGDSVTGR